MEKNDGRLVADMIGYCLEATAWRIIRDLSIGLTEGNIGYISPHTVVMGTNEHYQLVSATAYSEVYLPPEGCLSVEGCIWSLAATVFKLMMGCDVMAGLGGKGQKPDSPVPFMRSSMPELSRLVHHCLSFCPSQRPSPSDVVKVACERCAYWEKERRYGPKRKPQTASCRKQEATVSSWPEEMVALSLALLMFFIPLHSFSQQSNNLKLDTLVHVVASLRVTDASKRRDIYEEVKKKLAANLQWTRMDELIDENGGECRPTDRSLQWFRLNTILNNVEMNRTGDDRIKGDFLNGEDPRYRYSLLEKSVKAGATVKYFVKGRVGIQHFVVMPFAPENQSLEFRLSKKDGNQVIGQKKADGNIYLTYSGNLHPEEVLTLEITNSGRVNVAIVILNDNTGR